MNTRFPKSILALAVVGLLGAGSGLAGTGTGDCDGTGSCDNSGAGGQDQSQMQRRVGPAERMARVASRLGLTLQQQKDALDLFDAHRDERQQLRQRIFDEFGYEICTQRDLHRAEFRALLTEEQRALHDEQVQRRQGHANGAGGFGGLECPGDG